MRRDPSQVALVARTGKGKGGPKDKKKKEKSDVRCMYCKKLGHVTDECRKMKKDKEEKEKKAKTKDGVTPSRALSTTY